MQALATVSYIISVVLQADTILKPEDDVLGVVVDGETRAYSRTAITQPHLYYDTVGGVSAGDES